MASSSSAKEEDGLKSMRRTRKQEEEKRKKKKKQRYTLKELKGLGRDLLSSRAHINNLPILLNFISSEFPSQHVLESLLSLQSFFTPLLPNLPPSSSSSSSSSSRKKKEHKKDKDGEDDDDEEAEVIYRIWLRSKFDELVRLVIDLVLAPQPDQTLREVALDAIMEFVKMANGGGFHSAIYDRLLVRIVHAGTQVELLLGLLSSKYFKYIDVRYFTYITLKKLATSLEKPKDFSGKLTETADRDDESRPESSMELCIRNIHYILSHLPPLEDPKENYDYEMWSGSEGESKGLSGKVEDKQPKSGKHNNVLSAATIAKKMKLKFTNAWMSFLKIPLPLDVYKEVLVTLHHAVIPHLSNPKLLSDFLTRSYDVGGVISVMALSSLFILMTQHGLEYPNFYEKLYALLLPSIFMAKHRARFFELLDSCLKSPLLPAYLAAAFAKKLSRLALAVPPSGGLVIIALIHNLLRRHPSVNCLVHRDGSETSDGNLVAVINNGESSNETHRDISTSKLGIDHFNDDESNPTKANALRSSLWEIDTLRHHYCPPVSRFVLSLENDLTARAKTTEFAIKDFSSGSYATVFGDEIRRRVKQVPLAFYKAIPTCLFSGSEFAGWTFEHEKSKESNSTNGFLDAAKENDESPAKRQRVECCS